MRDKKKFINTRSYFMKDSTMIRMGFCTARLTCYSVVTELRGAESVGAMYFVSFMNVIWFQQFGRSIFQQHAMFNRSIAIKMFKAEKIKLEKEDGNQ